MCDVSMLSSQACSWVLFRHAFILCYDPSAPNTASLLTAAAEVYNTYLIHEDELLYAGFDVTSSDERK